jgi:hypothetical protein
MFDFGCNAENDRVHKYVVMRQGKPIPYEDVLGLWQHDEAFGSFLISLLTDSPFSAYRWETPPITSATVGRAFEFVLLNSPGLERSPDLRDFEAYFTNEDQNEGIVSFENLGRDAMLVVPSPRGPNSLYGHLAAFIRGAPRAQKYALWRTVGRMAQQSVTDHPLWVSTAGGGVAWLHVRLDSRPKYYGYTPYKDDDTTSSRYG